MISFWGNYYGAPGEALLIPSSGVYILDPIELCYSFK